jgi:hypothetical protein
MARKGWIAGIACGAAALWAAPEAVEAQAGAAVAARAPARELTVNRVFMVANGSMVQIRFTVPAATATQWVPVDPRQTYVVDEATGEKFFVMNLVRIGPLAQVRLPKGGGSSYMVIDNRHERLKPGTRITVVVGALKQEHVTVAEP